MIKVTIHHFDVCTLVLVQNYETYSLKIKINIQPKLQFQCIKHASSMEQKQYCCE